MLQRFPVYHCNLSSSSLPTNVAPINIFQVSKGWRQLALSQPFLWSFVRVDEPFTRKDLRRVLSRVETWLQRSELSSTPLTLDIRVPYLFGEEVDEDIPCEDVDSIFKELDRHKGRWENVTIHWHWHSYRLSENLPSLENLPMLQKLDYLELIPGEASLSHHDRRRVDLSTMPLLRQFTVIGFLDLLVPSNTVLSDLTIVHAAQHRRHRISGSSRLPYYFSLRSSFGRVSCRACTL